MRLPIVRPFGTLVLMLAAGVASAAAQQATAPPPQRPNVGPPLTITIPAFSDGGTIPVKHSCAATTPPPGGRLNVSLGVSPLVQWSNVPKGTASFVLILHDEDAHIAKAFEDIPHWVVFNIPGDATSLPEGVPPDVASPNGTMQGNNMMGRAAYQGSCALPGPAHHYTFELYALDIKLDLPQGAGRSDIQKAMDGHVLSGAVYIGLFHR
ncbi:MAG TPA: YbhB/YbcL family Raf kinase inhibitor-like protein [Candidatus Acidoferrales bacterium]|nr:YbhB/YbcL family Raf kinase inhibitor-like protein [Candidatus Acidoferrales bacterium]